MLMCISYIVNSNVPNLLSGVFDAVAVLLFTDLGGMVTPGEIFI
jgi:hypothetical protein